MGYVDTAYWLDVGTPGAFVQGSCDLVLGRIGSAALPGPCGESLVLGGAQVGDGVKLTGGTVVGAGCQVGDGATVAGSVLFDGAVVGAGAVVRGSVVGSGAQIAAGVVVEDAVVGDGASVAEGNELRCGMRVWPGVRLGRTAVRFSTDA